MKVIIIGGGIGGLCAAIALQQRGNDVLVYEQVGAIGEVGAGLTLWSNAVKVLRKLGVADRVIAAGAKIKQSKILTADGMVLSTVGIERLEERFGEPVIGIHRATLHEILIHSLKPNTLKLAMPCVHFEQRHDKVTTCFENGDEDISDLLIGADGIRSVIRKQMIPDLRLRYSGYTAWRGVVETENEVALGLTSESWGRGQRFGIVRVDKKRVYWFATNNQLAGEQISDDERKAKLLRLFKDWHAPVRDLLERTLPGAILQNDIHDIAPFAPWTQGRVTLIGDAAHPTTPNMGQGACMAIESAYVLSRCLKEHSSIKSALRRYEQERHARTEWVTNTSWQIGKVAQLENPILCALRNASIKIVPDILLERNLGRAVGFNVADQS